MLMYMLNRHIVTMGFEDNLQCLSYPKHTMDINKNFVLVKKLQTKEIKDMFKNPTTGFEPDKQHFGMNSLDYLQHVAKLMFKLYPSTRLVVGSDSDSETTPTGI